MSHPMLGGSSRLSARPGYEGANVRTWIGFKHFTYLVEAAVLEWFRERGVGPGRLFHEHGLGLSIVDCSLLLPHVLDVDDVVSAEATAVGGGRFTVRLSIGGAAATVVCRAKVGLALIREKDAPAHRPVAGLDVPVLDAIGVDAGPRPEPGLSITVPPGADPLGMLGRAAPGTYGWTWRVPYPYCQFSRRMAHSGYVRALEEAVDRFLAHRGISVGRLLAERGWIPVVSRSRVSLLADAYLEETMLTTLRIQDVLRGLTFDARMDCHAVRGGRLVPVATASILHGYAISRGPAAGQLAELDAAILTALTSGASETHTTGERGLAGVVS